jgi:Leucine-rich repeat (LRR) protein
VAVYLSSSHYRNIAHTLGPIEIINLAHFGGTLGRIPTRIGKFTNLQRLVAPDTNVVGTIPTELGNCKSLRFLDLSNNKLVSPIPTELGSLGWLQTMYLSEIPLTC